MGLRNRKRPVWLRIEQKGLIHLRPSFSPLLQSTPGVQRRLARNSTKGEFASCTEGWDVLNLVMEEQRQQKAGMPGEMNCISKGSGALAASVACQCLA